MLSDDEIWSRWKFPADLSWKEAVIALARAIEREARLQALEDAAQACEEDSGPIIDRWDEGYAAAQRSCVDAIRALKEQP